MKVRLLIAVCGLALLGTELSGCASTARNTRADEVAAEAMNLEAFPQIVLANAPRAEVKSVAMGAARSKSWSISRSTEDRLIVQRSLDAEALANLAAGAAFKPGTLLEITSYFVEQAGDTKVATRAELVAPAVGNKPPLRTDYTEILQSSLTDSLSSLRDSWAENRNRLARATPPAEGFKDAWAKDAPPVQSTTTRTPTPSVAAPSPPRTASDDVADAETESADANENAAVEPEMTPVARPPVRPVSPPLPVAKPKPLPLSPPAAVVKPVTPPPAKPVVAAKPAPAKPVTPSAAKPAPKLAATAASSATKPIPKPSTATAKITPPAKPVVAAKSTPATTSKQASKTSPLKTAAQSAPAEKSVAAAKPKPAAAKTNNMMELPKSKSALASSVSFAAQAETYAKQRGCKVGSKGTDLIESRKDGEIHKVPCVGADSVLVKCQKGSCKSLL